MHIVALVVMYSYITVFVPFMLIFTIMATLMLFFRFFFFGWKLGEVVTKCDYLVKPGKEKMRG